MKRYLKFLFSFVLSVGLMISPVLRVVSYADVNDLLISSDSNALMTLDLGDDDYGIMPVSGIGTVSNTIGGKLCVVARYVNPSTETYNYIESWIEPKDNRYEIKFQCPSNCYFYQFGIYLYKDNLPSPGTYNMSFDFFSQISCTYLSSLLTCVTLLDNAKTEITPIDLSSRIDTFSGDIYISPFSLNITPVNYCELSFNFDSNDEIRLIDGDFAVCFTKTVGDSSAPSTGPDYSSEDYQSDVSSSLSGLSSSVDSMTEDLSSAAESLEYISSSQNLIIQGIDNVIMHISDQLYAFWDQLYNLIHEPTYAKLEEILGALRAIANNADIYQVVEEIRASNNKVIANDNKLAADQIANDEANTEEIKDAVEEHGNFIIDGLKGLFIPSDEFFKAYFDDLFTWFSDRFGFLSFPIDLLARVVDLFVNSSDVDCVLTLPSFQISGEQLLYEQSFNLTDFLEQNFAFLFSAIRMVSSIGLIMAFVNLCSDKWNEVMRN